MWVTVSQTHSLGGVGSERDEANPADVQVRVPPAILINTAEEGQELHFEEGRENQSLSSLWAARYMTPCGTQMQRPGRTGCRITWRCCASASQLPAGSRHTCVSLPIQLECSHHCSFKLCPVPQFAQWQQQVQGLVYSLWS